MSGALSKILLKELWLEVFSGLPPITLLSVIPRVSKEFQLFINCFLTEEYWQKRCLKEKKVIWNDEKEFQMLTKGNFSTWKQVYVSSDLKTCVYAVAADSLTY